MSRNMAKADSEREWVAGIIDVPHTGNREGLEPSDRHFLEGSATRFIDGRHCRHACGIFAQLPAILVAPVSH